MSFGMLVLTIILSAILMVIVVAGLSIGWILTGKSRLRRGCGLRPAKKKQDIDCSICGNKKKCELDQKDSAFYKSDE